MKKNWMKRMIIMVLLAILLYAVGRIAYLMWQYQASRDLYDETAEAYTGGQVTSDSGEDAGEAPPITVDFSALQQVNEDVVGWIYCEDTVINYPVMQGGDNDRYLHHAYDGTASRSGSIFADANNAKKFSDFNTIIYGHHMKDKSMFATLSYWGDQAYYEEHPVMWLLTPEQNYKIVLFAGYTISANSDTYMIFPEAGEEFAAYQQMAVGKSDFQANVAPDPNTRCVLLSTCEYQFKEARYVLHGMLVPVGE